MNKILMKQVMMNRVLIALAPIVILSIFLFGWRVLAVVAVANIAAFVTEYLFIRQRKSGKVSMAVFVTGTLLALTLPPTIPFWIAIVGSVVAVSFGKMVFGGFGMNIFNPAIVGRTFIYISFPKAMQTTWLEPWINFPGGFASWMNTGHITSATPIATLAQPDIAPCWIKLFLGFIPGSIGETSALLIVFAGLYLITSKTAKWQPILATLASFAVFSLLFYGGNPLPMMLSGGLLSARYDKMRSRLGVTVTKKVGNAATRNKIKRFCREFFRQNQNRMSDTIDINIIAKKKATYLDGNETFRKLEDLFDRI